MKNRSYRRHQEWRKKQKSIRYWYQNYTNYGKLENRVPTEKWIGKMATDHNKPCSCSLGCGNKRKYFGPSFSELRNRSRFNQ